MTDLEKNLLTDFKLKVMQMMAKHDMLKQEKDQLLRRIGNLEQTIQELNEKNLLLEQKYENVKMAKLLIATEDDNKEAKNRIQKLVREIDKCIALLNQ